jgi:hypothetical protein
MKWLDRLIGSETDAGPVEVAAAPTPRDLEKVDFHIRRFTLALDQATDESRRAELQQNLDYWMAIKTAAALKPE